ncbi:MAG: hypothetical protein HYR73_09970 [Candidatus Eisenbacteria bacterium]|nr:hypothetical protein [Candidatus Eisenbacteria bacterium]
MTAIRFRFLPILTLALFVLLWPRPSHAVWPHDPAVNLPLCTQPNDQGYPSIASDGSGGAIIAWMDARASSVDIYALRVLASGAIAPGWTAGGVVVCNDASNQFYPVVCPDGAGGAFIAWEDLRGSASDVYASRMTAAGTLAPGWPASGQPVSNSSNAKMPPVIRSDMKGGAIVEWQETGAGLDLYAQRLDGFGMVEWGPSGKAVCTAAGNQEIPALTADDLGGALFAWVDGRGANRDIYALHLLSNGSRAGGWPVDGLVVCNAATDQNDVTIAPDGAAGAILAWDDLRAGNADIYGQHLDGSASVLWTANGLALCSASGQQTTPVAAPDGFGGALIAWIDQRNPPGSDVYGIRVLGSGTVPNYWPVNGQVIALGPAYQFSPIVIPDGTGGAIVAWTDNRSGDDVYAQHVSAGGNIDFQLPQDGVPVADAPDDQQLAVATGDGGGGAIFAWHDNRKHVELDIYAQHVDRWIQMGAEPSMASVRDVPNDQGGRVKVSWNASALDLDPISYLSDYVVLRSVPAAAAAAAIAGGTAVVTDAADLVDGATMLLEISYQNQSYYWEQIADVYAVHTAGYSLTASTTSDSLGGSNPRTAFMVEARQGYYPGYWFSKKVCDS